ncbi:MAG TPA: hypothetical protein VHN77_05735 [Phycisphaerales bacterium]|nr:hypothetical protein [Phycisphaerales bacterium]
MVLRSGWHGRLVRRTGAVVLGVGLTLGTMTGCEDKLTPENYAQLKTGMTISEAEKILGQGEREEISGVSISGAGIGGGSSVSVTYTWKAEDGRKIVATVKDGNITALSKFGF